MILNTILTACTFIQKRRMFSAHSEGVWLLGEIVEFCMMKIIDGNLNLTEKSGS